MEERCGNVYKILKTQENLIPTEENVRDRLGFKGPRGNSRGQKEEQAPQTSSAGRSKGARQ
jgi:hypothetical protein